MRSDSCYKKLAALAMRDDFDNDEYYCLGIPGYPEIFVDVGPDGRATYEVYEVLDELTYGEDNWADLVKLLKHIDSVRNTK